MGRRTSALLVLILHHLSGLCFGQADVQQTQEPSSQYLAICAATKDDGRDVREWADYHLAAGVSKIYLFDTDNPEPVEPYLVELLNNGKLEYYFLPRVAPVTVPLLQVKLYELCLQHGAARHTFIAFIDVDEFLVPSPKDRSKKLDGVLREFEGFAAVAVNWRLLGTSGWEKRPEGSVLSSFLSCTPVDYAENHQVKSIVNTRFATGVTSDPHHFQYAGGRVAQTTGGEPVDAASAHSIWGDRLLLYHFATKSNMQFYAKMVKGSAMGNRKGIDFLQRIDAASTQTCLDALEACMEYGVPSCKRGPMPASRAK